MPLYWSRLTVPKVPSASSACALNEGAALVTRALDTYESEDMAEGEETNGRRTGVTDEDRKDGKEDQGQAEAEGTAERA